MAGILGTQAVLVPLPGGTTNVVAGALGLGQDPSGRSRDSTSSRCARSTSASATAIRS
jgi:diacylglycerol kinase family enzyme